MWRTFSFGEDFPEIKFLACRDSTETAARTSPATMATTMNVTIAMATLPVYMLVTRGSGAEVNLRLEEDVCLGSTVNSWTILLVSCSVLLVVSGVFAGDVAPDGVGVMQETAVAAEYVVVVVS